MVNLALDKIVLGTVALVYAFYHGSFPALLIAIHFYSTLAMNDDKEG